MTKNTEVILYEEKDANAVTLFNGDGLDPFIEGIKQVAEEFECDLTTKKGRDRTISLAYKISKAKNLVKTLKDNENEQHKVKIEANNAKGKKAWDELQTLQDQVRKPVTDWENEDKDRIRLCNEKIELMAEKSNYACLNWTETDPDKIKESIKEVDDIFTSTQWNEFKFKAEKTHAHAVEAITRAAADKIAYDARNAESDRLRKAESDRLQKERDDAIALKAAEAARQEAEAEAEQKRIAEAAKAEAARSEAAAVLLKAQQDKDKAESERKAAVIAAEEAKKQAIVDKALAIKQAAEAAEALVKQKALADEQAEAAKQLAIETKAINAAAVIAAEKKAADQREVDRLKVVADLQKQADDQRAADLAVIAKREADEEHKKNVILEAKNALVAVEGLPYRLASGAIEAIVSGEIPHVSFNY